MNRGLSLFFGCLLLAPPAVLQAQFTYATNNGTVTITSYTGSGGAVTIPGSLNVGSGTNVDYLPVTGIGYGAFYNTGVSSVTIPDSVTDIGSCAFQSCSGLTSITIPDSVTSVGASAFFECSGLTNVIIGNGVVSLGDDAFDTCAKLAGVTIGSKLTTLGDRVFQECTSLTSITIPGSVTNSGVSVFFDCTSLTNVTFGKGATTIGGWAFEQCYGLTSVTIPSSLTNIDEAAFMSCVNLTCVYFQGNAPSLSSAVFAYDYNLSAFYYLPGTSGWSSTFYGEPAVMLNVPDPDGSLQVNNIPNGAQWQVDGGILQTAGATVAGLAVGNHTVSFSAVSGWTTPSNQIVFVGANSTATVNGPYESSPPLAVATTGLFDGTSGVDYEQQLWAVYGQSPYTWSLVSGSLPDGISLATNGLISGTPTASGTFNFVVQLTDALSETATQALSVAIANPVIQKYSVTESWSVTLTVGTGSRLSTKTYKGTENGTVTVTNNAYTLINKTGSALELENGTLSRTIVYDDYNGQYEISGSPPGVGGLSGSLLVIAPLSFFVIAVPTGYAQGGFSGGDLNDSQSFFSSGDSMSSFSGSGVLVDGNYPDTSIGYLNEVDESSVATLTEILPPPPNVVITSPTPGQRVGSAMLPVMGTASGSGGVVNVYYSLSNAVVNTGYMTAATSNNWANWNALATLNPGPNTISAYAVDSSGNLSATDYVSVDYVLSAPCSLNIIGNGKVGGLTNGQMLAIGQAYTVTATANTTSGFAFANWTGLEEGNVVLSTNKAVLSFVMQANLALTATFVDVKPPGLTITAPRANEQWSNSLFTAQGTASDSVGVRGVWYSFNNGAWTMAQTTNGWTNWNANLTLSAKTNFLQAYSAGLSSNYSKTAAVSFVYIRMAPLNLTNTGSGVVWLSGKQITNQTPLVVGTQFNLIAKPGAGFIFSNWTGSYNSYNSNLVFTMQTNTILVAGFVPNPFVGQAGTYSGLFTSADGIAPEDAGYFTATITTNGIYTGKITQGSSSPSVGGRFNLFAQSSTNITLNGINTTVALTWDTVGGVLSGIVSNKAWSSALWAERAGTNAAKTNYTVSLGSTGQANAPDGSGYMIATVGTNGVVNAGGKMADNATFAVGGNISMRGNWPVYAPLYNNKGIFAGWLTFTNEPGSDVNGSLTWTKPALAGYYTNGFSTTVNAIGSHYAQPAFHAGTNAIDFIGLTNALVRLSANNTATNLGPEKLSLTVGTNGVFNGMLTNGTQKIPFAGVVLQKQTNGIGYYLQGTNNSGLMLIEP